MRWVCLGGCVTCSRSRISKIPIRIRAKSRCICKIYSVVIYTGISKRCIVWLGIANKNFINGKTFKCIALCACSKNKSEDHIGYTRKVGHGVLCCSPTAASSATLTTAHCALYITTPAIPYRS